MNIMLLKLKRQAICIFPETPYHLPIILDHRQQLWLGHKMISKDCTLSAGAFFVSKQPRYFTVKALPPHYTYEAISYAIHELALKLAWYIPSPPLLCFETGLERWRKHVGL
jgi:hypothetical protein